MTCLSGLRFPSRTISFTLRQALPSEQKGLGLLPSGSRPCRGNLVPGLLGNYNSSLPFTTQSTLSNHRLWWARTQHFKSSSNSEKYPNFREDASFLFSFILYFNSTESILLIFMGQGIFQIEHTQTHLDTEQNYTLILNWKQPKLKMCLANTKIKRKSCKWDFVRRREGWQGKRGSDGWEVCD